MRVIYQIYSVFFYIEVMSFLGAHRICTSLVVNGSSLSILQLFETNRSFFHILCSTFIFGLFSWIIKYFFPTSNAFSFLTSTRSSCLMMGNQNFHFAFTKKYSSFPDIHKISEGIFTFLIGSVFGISNHFFPNWSEEYTGIVTNSGIGWLLNISYFPFS